jgi:hypothetical protein
MLYEHFIKFFKEFYGYGNWSSPDWFLGIEEGGGSNLDHVNQKLNQFYFWNNINEGLVDNFEFQSLLDECRAGGFLNLNNNEPKAQSTWISLIKALLYKRNGYWPTLEEAKIGQINNLGRTSNANINCALIELFPLPNPGVNEYNNRWNKWTLHFENNIMPARREDYENLILESRTNFIKDKIKKYKPKNIVAYIGTNHLYQTYLCNLAGINQTDWNIDNTLPNKNILYVDITWDQLNKTRFFRCYHPSRTNNNQYWQRVGELMI